MKDRKKKSLGRTIKIAMISLVVGTLAVVLLSIVLRLHSVQNLLVEYNAKLGDSAAEISSTSMEEEVTERLMQIARSQADIVDSNFGHFKATVELLAQDATYLYEHASEFGRIEIEEPKAENDGKLVVHITHSENTNMSDPAVKDEAGLMGNEQNTLISSHSGNPAMAKCYIATESGLMIEADRNSSDKLNEDGTVAFYEAAKRPWYYETKEAGETHFTNITPEASGKRIGMMCGSPVTKNGKFMGVACAGMYLDDVDARLYAAHVCRFRHFAAVDEHSRGGIYCHHVALFEVVGMQVESLHVDYWQVAVARVALVDVAVAAAVVVFIGAVSLCAEADGEAHHVLARLGDVEFVVVGEQVRHSACCVVGEPYALVFLIHLCLGQQDSILSLLRSHVSEADVHLFGCFAHQRESRAGCIAYEQLRQVPVRSAELHAVASQLVRHRLVSFLFRPDAYHIVNNG